MSLLSMDRLLSRLALTLLLATAMLTATACTQPPEGPPPSAANQPAQDDHSNEAEEADHEETDEEMMASKGDAARGEELYIACAACHGMDGEGVQGLGKDLHNNEFMASMSDEEIVDFLKNGRPAAHELNTTGVDMPPKGGNPALSDDDLYDIVAYMRGLE